MYFSHGVVVSHGTVKTGHPPTCLPLTYFFIGDNDYLQVLHLTVRTITLHFPHIHVLVVKTDSLTVKPLKEMEWHAKMSGSIAQVLRGKNEGFKGGGGTGESSPNFSRKHHFLQPFYSVL
jgi:hypothetical protein